MTEGSVPINITRIQAYPTLVVDVIPIRSFDTAILDEIFETSGTLSGLNVGIGPTPPPTESSCEPLDRGADGGVLIPFTRPATGRAALEQCTARSIPARPLLSGEGTCSPWWLQCSGPACQSAETMRGRRTP